MLVVLMMVLNKPTRRQWNQINIWHVILTFSQTVDLLSFRVKVTDFPRNTSLGNSIKNSQLFFVFKSHSKLWIKKYLAVTGLAKNYFFLLHFFCSLLTLFYHNYINFFIFVYLQFSINISWRSDESKFEYRFGFTWRIVLLTEILKITVLMMFVHGDRTHIRAWVVATLERNCQRY